MTEIHKIELIRTPPMRVNAAESAELFTVVGAGVYNRGHDHRILGYVGRCCDEARLHLHLSAQAMVISAQQAPRVPRLPVAIGDVIHVDYTDYRVCARAYADPILIPVVFSR